MRTRRSLVLAITAGGILSTGQNSRDGEDRSSLSSLEAAMRDHNFRGRISASVVSDLLKQEGLSRESLMLKLLPVARSRAYPPLSNYFVGAVALGSTGSLYMGANIEVPGNVLGLAVHAEQAAIANAYMAAEDGIEAIAVTAAPCGHCRQFLGELSLDGTMRVLVNDAPEMKLSDLLPQAFGPRNLGFQNGALPVTRMRMSLAPGSHDPLTVEALTAACMSYAPYTRSPSGAALETSNGRVFTGSYIENVAFNPSLSPLETALAGFFAAGSDAGTIQKVVLVEGEHNRISQQSASRAALSGLAPSARFDLVRATVS